MMEENENLCQALHDVLVGQHHPSWFSTLEALLQHWRNCAECQVLLPKAAAQIEYIENSWLMQIRSAVEQLHRDCDSEKQKLIREDSVRREAETNAFKESHPPDKNGVIVFDIAHAQAEMESPSQDQRLHGELLNLLADKGEAIREQLEDMNDSAGLDYFRLASEDGHCEYRSRLCGSLIASLSKETQNFVFQAILTADITSLFRDGFPAESEVAIHRIVERAAPGFRRAYFEGEKPGLEEGATSFLDNSGHRSLLAVSEGIGRLASDFWELKAGQMETIRILEHKRHQLGEIIEDLQNRLGKELFANLCGETRRYLQMAERYFRGGVELDDFVPSIHNFHRAYESEFGQRIIRPLVQKLVQEGCNQYGIREGRVPPLIQAGQLSKLGLGQQLSYLRNDKLVREVVSDLGFEVDRILETALVVNRTRNEVTHGNESSRAEAGRVRDILLGPHGGLKALFPKSKF